MGEVIALEAGRRRRQQGRRPGRARARATLYFDLVSPATYLAAERVNSLFPGSNGVPRCATRSTGAIRSPMPPRASATSSRPTARASALRLPLVWPEGTSSARAGDARRVARVRARARRRVRPRREPARVLRRLRARRSRGAGRGGRRGQPAAVGRVRRRHGRDARRRDGRRRAAAARRRRRRCCRRSASAGACSAARTGSARPPRRRRRPRRPPAGSFPERAGRRSRPARAGRRVTIGEGDDTTSAGPLPAARPALSATRRRGRVPAVGDRRARRACAADALPADEHAAVRTSCSSARRSSRSRTSSRPCTRCAWPGPRRRWLRAARTAADAQAAGGALAGLPIAFGARRAGPVLNIVPIRCSSPWTCTCPGRAADLLAGASLVLVYGTSCGSSRSSRRCGRCSPTCR